MSKRLDTFAQLEHVDQLKNHFLPKIAKFAIEIDDFNHEIQDTKEAVRALDESLSLKCNKSHLLNFEKRIQTIFISHQEYKNLMDENAKVLVENQNLLAKLQKSFDDCVIDLNSRIDHQCEIVLKEKFMRYEQVRRDFSKFFNIELLEIQFDKKADMEMITMLNDQKVNNTDLAQTRYTIENLNERVKHLSVIQSEMANYLSSFKGKFSST